MHVSDASFVVTDTETTGLKAESNRIIEIGAVKVEHGRIVDRFQQLIDPQRSIPSRITNLTGITTGMVFDAPTIEEVLPEYLDFLDDGILAAHNLSFDKGFLDAELERAGMSALSNETLCTVRLARRLLPGLNSKGLSRLVDFYGINVNGRHRALGDAEATGIILQRFLRQLSFEHEVETVENLLAFQHRRYQQIRSAPSHLKEIRQDVLPEVPSEPGVYRLENGNGTSLYIGKAKDLSDRLRSHFTAIESKSARKRKMLQKVRAVDWETTGTELEAILRESRRIKTEQPKYNRAQRRYYSRPFIRLDVAHEYPTVSWQRTIAEDEAEYYGPIRNAELADIVVDVVNRFFSLRECDDDRLAQGERCLYADLERCTAPCECPNEDAYSAEVNRVRAFLMGKDQSVLDRLRERMREASAEHDYERAAEFRDVIQPLKTILDKQAVIQVPIRRHDAALIHESGGGGADIFLVRSGRFVGSVSCGCPPTKDQRSRLRKRCYEHFDPDGECPSDFSKRAVDEIRLLSHWTCNHRDELDVVRWDGKEPANLFSDRVVEAVGVPVEV